MAATTMRARHAGRCAATARLYPINTVIFRSVLGWAIFDADAFAAVRAAVAAGRTGPASLTPTPRTMAAQIAADPDALTRLMDRADSAL